MGYVDHFIPAMISWKFDKKASSSPKYSKLYDFVTDIIGDFLIEKSVASFHAELAGTFPQALLDEMQGIVDGAKAANAATKVSLDRIITLNYGMDYLSTQVFGGGLVRKLQAWARAERSLSPELDELLNLLQDDFFEVPMFCDAFEGEQRVVPAPRCIRMPVCFRVPAADPCVVSAALAQPPAHHTPQALGRSTRARFNSSPLDTSRSTRPCLCTSQATGACQRSARRHPASSAPSLP